MPRLQSILVTWYQILTFPCWFDDESKHNSKAIDVCNNAMTKEPKLVSAKWIIGEWVEYDDASSALTGNIYEAIKAGNWEAEKRRKRACKNCCNLSVLATGVCVMRLRSDQPGSSIITDFVFLCIQRRKAILFDQILETTDKQKDVSTAPIPSAVLNIAEMLFHSGGHYCYFRMQVLVP